MLGVGFDNRGADQAEKRIAGLGQKMATLFGFWQAFDFARDTVQMASDVEQTMSKLDMVFKGQRDNVLRWAETYSAATGASEYQLREMAGTFGSMLAPTLKFDYAKAAEMSTTLSALAFDLGALNNENPQETLGRLFSGMTGETEAVERLGIGIKAAALEEFNRTRGSKKAVTQMTVAEKTELIYHKILNDTKNKVGAAAKESDSYAGKMLKLSAAWRDFKTTIGMFLIGPAARLVQYLRDTASAMTEWAKSTTHMQAAAVVLGGIMLVLGGQMLLGVLPAVLAFGAIYLVVEDLIHLFKGEGRSAIGGFLDVLGGAGTAKMLVQDLKTVWKEFADMVKDPEFKIAVRDTFADLIQAIHVMIVALRMGGTGVGTFMANWREQRRLSQQLANREITWEEYDKRTRAMPGVFDSMRGVIDQANQDTMAANNKYLPPKLPQIGSSAGGIDRHGRAVGGGNVTFNWHGKVTLEDAQNAERLARSTLDHMWKGAFETSTPMTRRPPPDVMDPVTDPPFGM